MLRLTVLVIFLAVLPWSAKAGFSLQDLEILSQEGGHEEFFKHAMDVRPSERLDTWKSMVSKMAETFAQSVLTKTTVDEAKFKRIEELYRWPSLRTDDVYKLRRQEIGLRYLKACLKAESPCWEDLKNFWETDPADPEVAIRLAELTLKSPPEGISTWVFLDVALKSPLSEFYCKKDFVMASLWSKLELDYIRLGTKGDLLKKIDQTIHPDCLPALNREAYTRLYSPEKAGDRELGYQILNAQTKINPKMTDFFYTVYLLETPSQGELFNYAWSKLSELGKSSERRTVVFDDMKKLDPLPDTIFSSLDLTKKRVILNHFKQNFPEYLDYYANQCVDYYGGNNSFPQGNPTINCQQLMNSDLAIPNLGEDKVNEFLKARKI